MAALAPAPLKRVQYLADQAALVNLYAVPHAARAEHSSEEFRTRASLQRFESIASRAETEHHPWLEHEIEQALRDLLPNRELAPAARFRVRQQIGEGAGVLDLVCRWGTPGADGVRPFRVSAIRFSFSESDWAEGVGAGRIYPVADGCETVRLFAAVGEITKASGKLHDLTGTFALNGSFDEKAGFAGVATCRFFDPGSRLRTHREIEAPLGFPETARASFLELSVASGEGGTSNFEELAGGRARLTAESRARAARFVTVSKGYRGLQSQAVFASLVGTVETTLEMDAGKIPLSGLSGKHKYRVNDARNVCVGTLEATLDETVSIGLRVPGEQAPLAQFAGIGRIGGGTGVFQGVAGVFAENSAIALGPAALSLLHVTQIADASGRFRTVP